MAKITKPSTKKLDNMSEASDNLQANYENMVSINFKVPKKYRNEFKAYALKQDKSMTDILFEAIELHKKNNG